MKKQMARAFLSLIMVLSVSACMLASAKGNTKVCTSAADLGEIVMDGYNLGKKGSVQIIEGTYTSNKGNTFDVYVVTVSGTEMRSSTKSQTPLFLLTLQR